ncbi:MAG: CPBP family intramembrane metalloprotease [Leptolyngbyaceae cyanobacterium RU_5_1]|nr:CPBP family intramembrane metalloprotease [Leptolyngbyaceae cyanobacterium RU_5_1]
MTIKRMILVVVTALAIATIGFDLWESWGQPQVQSRLELYQTNLVLQATEWNGNDPNSRLARKALTGNQPAEAAIEAYQELRQSAQKSLKQLKALSNSPAAKSESPKASVLKLERLIAELDLRLGILHIEQKKISQAQATWTDLVQQSSSKPALDPINKTTGVLSGLWSNPPQIYPNAEPQIKQNLDGWFRYRALSQLYQLQQRQDALSVLQTEEQQAAEQAFNSLAVVGGIPVLACLVGGGILLFLGGQWLIQRKQALLSAASMAAWSTPWDGEIIWQVMILGFFLVGQVVGKLLVPFAVVVVQSVLSPGAIALSDRAAAAYSLLQYLLMAAGGLGVLYLILKPFLPLPEGWFRVKLNGNWLWWGLGGYFTAQPLVILVAFLNQKIWQGQGGSNPILPIVLESKDTIALILFFITAAIAAPIFEEILFRGFLLPSLTRYFPVWGAIALSSLIFAIAHLSLSEVLPLTTLGFVLGFVYARR